jgi:rhodanese-related sulfurtransferase
MHIPLPELRDRLAEIPKERDLIVYCQSGQRSYVACRILSQHGYRCWNLSGSYITWSAGQESEQAAQSHALREQCEAVAAR